MSSKRHRGEGSSSTPTRLYDRRKFVSVDAADRYDSYASGKALTPERGLTPEPVDGEMLKQIQERNWETFTAHPQPACIAVVKEFYANAEDTALCEVTVRGKTVSFSAQSISEYFNLDSDIDCDYTRFLAGAPNLDKVIADLCKPGTKWITKGPRASILFKSKDLSRYGKVWYAFLSAKLMPSQHVSDVPKEKALLLYAIVTGFDIDVGDVISASIRRTIRNLHGQGGLPHPSLICGLCSRAGVHWGAEEAVQQPLLVLDHRLILRYKDWDGGQPHPRGMGFVLSSASEEESDSEDRNSDEGSGPSAGQRSKFTLQFRELQSLITSQHQTLLRQNQCLAERQQCIYDYQVGCSNAIADMYHQMQPLAAPVHFPVPPPLPVFPPPDSVDRTPDAPDA